VPPDLAPTEIAALARIVDELDYFQLLHVERGAAASEVKQAYYQTSRAFHPDANRHLEPEQRVAVAKIAKRVTEAYSVLRDARRHQAYLRHLESGEGVRMQLAEAQAEAGRHAIQNQGRTPQGRQYYNLATADLRREDFPAAARNLQTALTFEPDNEFFKAQLKAARAKDTEFFKAQQQEARAKSW
jgi:curved DNA-binding protein CbpA